MSKYCYSFTSIAGHPVVTNSIVVALKCLEDGSVQRLKFMSAMRGQSQHSDSVVTRKLDCCQCFVAVVHIKNYQLWIGFAAISFISKVLQPLEKKYTISPATLADSSN
jgi:hypothetical protein